VNQVAGHKHPVEIADPADRITSVRRSGQEEILIYEG
jgi:hypothetical protein